MNKILSEREQEILIELHYMTEQAKINYANACLEFNLAQKRKRARMKELLMAQDNELKGGR